MTITEAMVDAAQDVVPALARATVRAMLEAALVVRRRNLPPLEGYDLTLAEKILCFARKVDQEFFESDVSALGSTRMHVSSLLPRMADRGMLVARIGDQPTGREQNTRRRRFYRLP